MNLIKKKIFILFCCVIFLPKSSINSSSSIDKKIEPQQHPFIKRLQQLSKNNPPVFSFLIGLGSHYIFKKAADNIYKKIILPACFWGLLHTSFLLGINKDKKNIKKILIPFPIESLKKEENYLSEEFSCFPLINFTKKIISENQNSIKKKFLNLLNLAKKSSLIAGWTTFGFISPLLYKKLENYFIKKILWYCLAQESFTLGTFLTNRENRNVNAIKEYFHKHLNLRSELEFYGSSIKIYPFFNFVLDSANTVFFKQNTIDKFMPVSPLEADSNYQLNTVELD